MVSYGLQYECQEYDICGCDGIVSVSTALLLNIYYAVSFNITQTQHT